MSKIEIFPWNENLEIGIELVDTQHKELVKLLNLLAYHIVAHSEITTLNEVLEKVSRYADYHFTKEESVWGKHLQGDELFLSHLKTHSSFEEKIKHYLKERTTESEEEVIEKILKYLISWLAMHILDSDKRMAMVIQEMNNGASLKVAKEKAERDMNTSQGLLIATILEMYENVSASTLELLKERSERIKLESELKKSQENEKVFNDAIMNAVPGLVGLYDDKLELIRWNKGHNKELGYTNNELKNKQIFDFVNTDEVKKVAKALEGREKGGELKVEQSILTKDGLEIPYIINGINIEFENKDYFLLTGINISNVKQTEDELREALRGVIRSVSKAMEARDPYTAGHQERVANISVAIAKEMGMNDHQIEGLRLGASIHDIGKLAIPSELLTKPTRLTDLEYAMIQTHAEAGGNIMQDIKFPWPILEIVSQHHERIDGSGYPLGLTGEQMTLESKIVAVADVFEAMSSHRPYRPSLGLETAVEELKRNSGRFYDPEVVKTLLELLENDMDLFSL